jgi:outer membrane immunogenic protein
MKSWISAAAVAVTLAAASTAFAADIAKPVYKAPPVVVPVYNWTGFYIGGNAGYSWAETDVTYFQGPFIAGGFGAPFAATGFSRAFSPNNDRFAGGGQIGFNYQVANWVFGIESDLQSRRSSGTFTELFATFSDSLTIQSEEKWFGTTRGRIGWAANNWLYYATGGVAYGRVDDSVTRFCNVACGPQTQIVTSSRTLTGWTVGGGIEVGLSPNWTIAAEYLYVDLGNNSIFTPGLLGPLAIAATTDYEHKFQVARVKLNYKFDWSKSPVVAKY